MHGALAAQVHGIDAADLSPQDRLSLQIFAREVDVDVEGQPYRLWHLVLDQRDGIQTADDLADSLRFDRVADYEAWIARLKALPAYVDGAMATMREGIAEHIVQPRIAMERVPAQIARQLVDDPERSPFWSPLRRMPASIPAPDQTRLRADARAAIAGAVVPAYRRFADFFAKEYLPACFTDVGAWQLPHGDEAYAYLARMNTTTTHDAAADPRRWPARGRAHPQRDARTADADGLQRRTTRLLRGGCAATRSSSTRTRARCSRRTRPRRSASIRCW